MAQLQLRAARWYLRRRVHALGIAGSIAIGLAVGNAIFLLSALIPNEMTVGRLRAQAALQATQQLEWHRQGSSADPSREVPTFYASFPPAPVAPDLLARIFDAARARELFLHGGDYRLATLPGDPLLRYEVVVPVSGTYPAIRLFVGDVLNRVPTASLDSLSFQRQSNVSARVAARVRFTIFMRVGT